MSDNPYDNVCLPPGVSPQSLMVGFGRTISCRRFLEELNDGSVFGLVSLDGTDRFWIEMNHTNGSKSYYANVVGFQWSDPDNMECLALVDGLGIELCKIDFVPKKPRPGEFVQYRAAEKIPQSLIETCGYAGDFVANRYVEIRPKVEKSLRESYNESVAEVRDQGSQEFD